MKLILLGALAPARERKPNLFAENLASPNFYRRHVARPGQGWHPLVWKRKSIWIQAVWYPMP